MFEFKVQGIPSEWKSKESYTITVECSPPLKSWNGSLKHVSLIAIPSLPFKTVELFHVSEPDLILFDHQTSFVFKQVRIDLTKINFKERVSLVCSIQIEWLDPMNPLFIPNQFKGYLFSCPFVVQSTTIDLSIEKSNCNSIDNNELIGLIESAITDSSHNTRLKYDLKRKFETVHNTTHINRKQPRKVIHIYTSNSIESGPVHSFPSHFDIDSWNIDTISIDQYGNVCFSGNSSVFDLNDDEDVSVNRLDNPEEVVLKEDGKIYELNTGKEVIDMDEYNTKHKNAQDTIVESLYMKLFTKYGNPVVKSTPILIFHTPHGLICYNACTDTLVTRK